MEVPGLSPNTHFFDTSLQLDPGSSLPFQTTEKENNENKEQPQTSNMFLEIGRVDADDRVISSESVLVNLEDVSRESNCASIDENKSNPENIELISNPAVEESTVQWFEEDVDLTKIFLCNTEGDLEVDEFNLGFSENILFGSEEDHQQVIKEDKTSASELLEERTCLELNNNYESGILDFHPQNVHENTTVRNETKNGNSDLPITSNKEPLERDSSKSNKNPFNCVYCCKSFRYSSRLKRHLTTHQNKQYPCRICHKLFSRIDVMEVHIARTHIKAHQQKLKKEVISKEAEVRFCIPKLQ